MWLGVPFLCARILHLSLLNFDHGTSFVLWMWVWSVCPFRAGTFNSYFVVYQLCILPQPWSNIWDRECSIHTGPPVRRTWSKTAVNPHWKCSISKYKLVLMKVNEILVDEVHHNLCYHNYPDLQLDDRYSYGQKCCLSFQ